MTTSKTMLVSLLLLPLGSLALAQSTPPASSGSETVGVDLSPLDADRDGRISRAEAEIEPPLAQVFTKIDKNADGYIDAEEAKVIRVPKK